MSKISFKFRMKSIKKFIIDTYNKIILYRIKHKTLKLTKKYHYDMESDDAFLYNEIKEILHKYGLKPVNLRMDDHIIHFDIQPISNEYNISILNDI